MNYAQEALKGNKLAAGRIIKMVEDDEAGGYEAIKRLYPHTGGAFCMGITGPPGAGKSTLINCLIAAYRARGQKVGVIAIDPSSAITGGALLGDRIRMKRHGVDPGVFMRSIATRGALGGISRAAKGALIVLDAMKYDIILMETAGVGQLDVDISLLAHMTLVLCIPGMGDALQALKAGTLEIADLFVVNKADKPGANDVENHLVNMLNLKSAGEADHRPGIIRTVASTEEGIDELLSAIAAFRKSMTDTGTLADKSAAREYQYLKVLIRELVAEKIWHDMENTEKFAASIDMLKSRRTDPYSAAQAIMKELLKEV